MFQRIRKKKYRIKAMDIETHNDEESIAKKETSMWLGCYIDENSRMEDESSYFYSMDEWLDTLQEETTMKRHNRRDSKPVINLCIYIYNLSFEWSFILPYLLKRGFQFKETFEDGDEFVYNTISTPSVSSVWCINMKFGKSNGLIVIKDLAKIYGGGLGNVAKSFGLETQKGEIDYRKNRLHNYTITQEEKEYCFKDTRIIIEILLAMEERDDKDFWQANSMASYSMKKLLKRGFPRAVKPYQDFRKLYPELDETETEFLRRGVEGGITYAPDKWQFKVIKAPICHIDAHQMHPSSAFLNLFPYGVGKYFKGRNPLGYISACRIRISYDDVKLHSIIKLIGLPFITDFELVVWNFEIPTMYKCYVNLKVEYIDGYAYKMRPLPWRRYYADNYYKRLEAKKKKDSFNVLYYKLLNNSSYGKFLEKPHNVIFENIIDENGIINSKRIPKEEDDIRFNATYTYIPVGSCIPAYSRVALIELALKFGWQNIVYFDTDSIFFLWTPETEKVYKNDNIVDKTDFLGGWAMEEMIDKAQFTAPKRYKTETDGKTTIKAGGINFNEYIKRVHNKEFNEIYSSGDLTEKEAISQINLPFDEINIVNSSWKVQRAYRVKGGTIIEFQEKDIKVPKKYVDIYERNK